MNISGKKKSDAPYDDSQIRLSHPDHVRVLIGDLSDGVAGTDDSDEEMSEAEEEAEDEGESEEVCLVGYSVYFWVGCAAGTMKPLPYARPCSADLQPCTRLDTKNTYPIPDLLF